MPTATLRPRRAARRCDEALPRSQSENRGASCLYPPSSATRRSSMVLRSSTRAPWNSFTNSAHVVWSELTRRMPSLTSALSMMSRICLVMSRTWVRFSLSIVKVFRTTFKVCTSLPPWPPAMAMAPDLNCVSAHGAEGGNRTPTALADQRILSPLRLPVPPPRPHHRRPRHREAASGFEPLNRGFADLRLNHLATPPHVALTKWSGKRDSNPRPQPWQGCALPLSYSRNPFAVANCNKGP